MKAIKFFALAVMALVVFACSKSEAVSEEQLKRADELATKGDKMTAEEREEAVNLVVEFTEKAAPEMAELVKGKTMEEAKEAAKDMEKKYANMYKLAEALFANMDKLTPEQQKKLNDANKKADKIVSDAIKK